MSAIVNARDLILRAVYARTTYSSVNKALLLSASTPIFHINGDASGIPDGSATPPTISLTATLVNIAGTVVFTCTGSTVTTNGNVATVAFTSLTGSAATVTATVVESGVTYTASQVLSTVIDGTAAITSERTTRQGADFALASRIDTVSASTTTNAANITSEATARVNADSALAQQISTISASSGNAASLVQQEATARAAGDSANASLITNLHSSIQSRPNLLPNGGFESEFKGWSADAPATFHIETSVWGRTAMMSTFSANGSLYSDLFVVQATAIYVIAGDSCLFAQSGSVYFDLLFYDGTGTNIVGDSNQNPIAATHDFSVTDSNRSVHAIAVPAPATATYARARFVWSALVNPTACGCRLIKVERGDLPFTPYSVEGSAGDIAASVKQEATTRADRDGALAQQITSLTSTVNSNYANYTSTVTTLANTDSALSTRVDSLSSTVGGHTTTISQNTNSINGISANYGVRINNNSRIVGFGLNSGAGGVGGFFIQADAFAISSPNNPSDYRFYWNGSSLVVSGDIYANNFYGNVVDTGNIKDRAVTNAYSQFLGDHAIARSPGPDSAWFDVNAVSIGTSGYPVTIFFSAKANATCSYSSDPGTVRIVRDDIPLYLAEVGGQTPISFSFTDYPGAGSHVYKTQVKPVVVPSYNYGSGGQYPEIDIWARSLIAMEIKK